LKTTLPDIIQRLDKFGGKLRIMSDASARKHANGAKKEIQDGLKSMNLVTPPLKSRTIRAKARKGYSQPSAPLLATQQLSLSLTVRKLPSGGYRLAPHGQHAGGISNQALFQIHEYGAKITDGFGKGISITIPARFPFRAGVNRYNRKIGNDKPRLTRQMKEALTR